MIKLREKLKIKGNRFRLRKYSNKCDYYDIIDCDVQTKHGIDQILCTVDKKYAKALLELLNDNAGSDALALRHSLS